MAKAKSLSEIQHIGVIGAGQMGNGIAHVAAQNGFKVTIVDINPASLEKALATIGKNMERQIQKGSMTEADKKAAEKRLNTSTKTADLADCDLIIEAATENEEVKKKIFKEIDGIAQKKCIIASNTSSISITRLAAVTSRPEKFIGLHFMNPVPMMALVEIIRGLATSQETYERVLEVAHKMGKTVATSEDVPGFIVNRLLLPMLNEAAYALQEGVADIRSLDTAMRLGAGHPMGPLQLADFIGLDTCVAIMRVLHNELGDSKYRPCPLLVKFVDAGWLGKKTGRGFYDYSDPANPKPTR
ncbi:MAG: 3-hydroxybutyryl-CoA dehydrogenase [Alphaproteobacteria bacterium]|nr:MAG: 3-hydroxybutyryl-CoA dehydrogenase [Alphaproteobacteria bacterium]